MGVKQAKKKQSKKKSSRLKRKRIVILFVVLAALLGILADLTGIIADSPSTIKVIARWIKGLVCPPPPPPPPPLPKGLVIFDANEWQEQVIGGTKGIVCTLQTELIVKLRKVGSAEIPGPDVERFLTYSMVRDETLEDDALEIEYEFPGRTEIGVHFLVYGFTGAADKFVRLDEYEGGCLFLRIKPVDVDDEIDTKGFPGVTFGLKLEQGTNTFWDGTSYSSSSAKPFEPSEWRDIRIPVKPYLDQMKKISSTEPAKLERLMLIFGDTYRSSRHGRFRLNAIRLVRKEDMPD